LLKQFPSIKLKIKANIAFLPKVAREFLFALARLASCKINNNLARQSELALFNGPARLWPRLDYDATVNLP
jgi:hypothetical protein